MKSKMGIQMQYARQVYIAVCLPKMLYAAELWASIRRHRTSNNRQPRNRAPKGLIGKMASVQRRALVAISGAMRTTPTVLLEAHLNILPIDLHLDNVRHRALIRLSTLPPSNPIHQLLRDARQTQRTSHIPALTALTRRYDRTNPDLIEEVAVTRNAPNWQPDFNVKIATGREMAMRIEEIQQQFDDVRVYSDGSAHGGRVGAAAHLVRADGTTRSLQLHLGRDSHYTVHTAEAVGIVMAAHLLLNERKIPACASIGVDNQAVLQGCQRHRHGRGQWAIDVFRTKAQRLAPYLERPLEMRWTPGHIGIDGNEAADELAKTAADGPQHSSPPNELPEELRGPIPRSAAAIQQSYRARTKNRAATRWRRYKRQDRLMLMGEKLPSNSYLKLMQHQTRRQSSLLIRLRTGHGPLNQHLWRIKCSDTPGCAACGDREEETVRHLLLECPAYEDARRQLRNAIGPRKSSDLRFLLGDPKALNHLYTYVDRTKRFHELLGTISRHDSHIVYD
jgi:ribonuclease HI